MVALEFNADKYDSHLFVKLHAAFGMLQRKFLVVFGRPEDLSSSSKYPSCPADNQHEVLNSHEILGIQLIGWHKDFVGLLINTFWLSTQKCLQQRVQKRLFSLRNGSMPASPIIEKASLLQRDTSISYVPLDGFLYGDHAYVDFSTGVLGKFGDDFCPSE